MLYNGVSPYPNEAEFRLSDAFEDTAPIGITKEGSPALELVAKVVNINEGRNEGIARKCRTLAEYSAFIDKVREFKKETGNLKKALTKAIKYCLEHDILKEFLEKNKKEVINMLMTEWNWDDALAVQFKEGKEEVAKNALAKGASIEFVKEITGFDDETIRTLQEELSREAN